MSSIFEHYSVGYHSCDKQVGESVLAGLEQLNPSQNRYDWLGSGIYFWESNIRRAYEYAQLLSTRKRLPAIKDPFVIGAIFRLGNCLDLLQSENLLVLKQGYGHFCDYAVSTGKTKLPKNRPLQTGADLLFRD